MVILGVFIFVAFWTYNTYVAPKLKPQFVNNKEFINEGDDASLDIHDARIYIFYTDWCPHCQAVMKKGSGWKTVQEKYNKQKINGVELTFMEINGETEDGQLKDFETEHNISIDGYPSIYLIKGDSVIEFEAEPTEDNLINFLNTAL